MDIKFTSIEEYSEENDKAIEQLYIDLEDVTTYIDDEGDFRICSDWELWKKDTRERDIVNDLLSMYSKRYIELFDCR